MKVSICSNVKKQFTITQVEAIEALKMLKDGHWKSNIEYYRKNKTRSNKENLPSIMWSGIFKDRSDNSLSRHSGLLCIDFDKVENVEVLKKTLSLNKYTFGAWISPSGDGVKCLVKTKAGKETHKEIYTQLCYDLNIPYFDKSCTNIARHCFVSYDPDLFVNEKSEVYDPVIMPRNNTYENVLIPNTDKSTAFNILEKWFSKNYGMITGSRNTNAFVLAKSCNDYGIERFICENYLLKYTDSDFTKTELNNVLNSAYKDHLSFGTKFFEDEYKINNIKRSLSKGFSNDDIIKENEVDIKIIDSIKEELSTFWKINTKGEIAIIPHKFKYFLQDNGFFIYKRGDVNDRVFVRIQNRIASIISSKEIKDFVTTYLEEISMMKVWDCIAEKTKLFESKYLDFLDYIEINTFKNNEDCTRFYFKDCAVDVLRDEVRRVNYCDVNEVVWDTVILPINYTENISKLKCDYDDFVLDICDNNIDKYKAFCSVIGYMTCGYNRPGTQKAICLNDRNKGKLANGGSGKGIFVKGITKLKPNYAYINSTTHKMDRTHIWNAVDYDTEIVQMDEVPRDFKLNNIYSEITEGISIEKKYRDSIKIPFEKTPKFILASNYGLDTTDGSTLRRIHELELSNLFNHNYTPEQKYGKQLLNYVTDDEWASYLEFMFGCIRFYKQNGLIKDVHFDLKEKKMINNTNEDFWDFFQEYEFNYDEGISKDDLQLFGNELDKDSGLADNFKNQKIPINLLRKWLETAWGHAGIKFKYERRMFNGVRERRYYFLEPELAKEIQRNKYSN